MTQHTKNGPYLWQEGDNGILTVEAGCTVVMSSSLMNYAGLAGWSVEESWADLVWSGKACLFQWSVRKIWSGLVWSGLVLSSLVIWIQELVWPGGLFEKIGSICGKEKEK